VHSPAAAAAAAGFQRYTDPEVLLTSAYDNTAKLFATRDFSHIKTLTGHEGRVSRCQPRPARARARSRARQASTCR
jgi:hypothetical protein